MYKQALKQIHTTIKKQEEFVNNLHKNIGEKPHPTKQPHFIFSAEEPRHPRTLNWTHDQTLDFLKHRGYNAEEIQGKYGGKSEKSIMVKNPHPEAINHLMNLSTKLGQDSSIYSSGHHHEMHFHHGENAGKHLKGQGTNHHVNQPEDNYSTLRDSHFTHNFNWDYMHDPHESIIPQKSTKMKKSEKSDNFYLRKNEDDKHPLWHQVPDINLIHFSHKEGLTEIDPVHHGVRGIGSETKQGKPKHPMSFYYLEKTKPESIVTTGVKSKYVSKLGDKRIYDMGKDPENFYSKAKELANKRQVNRGIVRTEDFHQAIKDAGYHGVYNSNLNETMRNVVGMFDKMPVHKEYSIHQNDFKEASAKNHHAHKESLSNAKIFADETGHHNPKFLASLDMKYKGKKNG